MILAIEGVDASGKATQARLLAERLRTEHVTVYEQSFPNYETATGKLIRQMLRGERSFHCGMHGEPANPEDDALALQSLMVANRMEQFGMLEAAEGLAEQVRAGHHVLVLDRYWLSGYAYGVADGLDEAWLWEVHRALPRAHHIILDLDPAEALCRRPEARDRFERDRAKQVRVREAYRGLARRTWGNLVGRVHLVDGSGTVEEVAERVWAAVRGTGLCAWSRGAG